ncbi:hypothetical protein QJQ45_016684 [Haematococcus lacustris]|nr:hypothetical protein QJQ45_016684 [Haematococcus lacustris]
MADMLEDMPVNPQDFERTPAGTRRDVPRNRPSRSKHQPRIDAMHVEMEEALEDDDGEDVTYGSDEVGKEVKVTPDGGIVKKILVQGSGWDKPEAHDVVTVHYVGTLTDGTTFDSSRDRNEPFTFTLGEGRVIKGWDQGVATMKKGEKAVLTCAPDYAYGESGSPPKIPPNATLNFEVELLSWQSVKDIMGDGGVIKTTTVEGSGWENPNDMDEALVKFSARVPGASEPFAQSGAEPTQFVVGQGLLGMKGTSVAVKKMKKGETAKLLLKPEYAFGPEGQPALKGSDSSSAVPPDANVEVDLELVGWHKVENVSDDGGVVKKTLVESSEWKRPNEGAKVTLRGVGRLEDGTVFDQWAEGSDLTFTTDEEQVPLGLDLAVQKMKQGEKALVSCSPAYAYGPKGHAGRLAQVPADASVSFELELVSFENAKETWEMSDADKVAAAVVRKDKGNAAYKAGNLARAVHQYDKAVSLLSVDTSFPEDIKAQAKEVRKSAALNLAAAHLRQQSWAAAAKEASRVLEQDSFNVKALYRRAQAYIGTADFAEAEADVKKGLSAEPGNADLAALLKKLKVLMREQNKKEAALYSRMFKFPAAVAPKTAPVVAEAVSTEQLAPEAAPEQATAAEADLPTMTAAAPEPAMVVEAH